MRAEFLAQPVGQGYSQQIVQAGAAPGAGASFTQTIDSAFVWRLVSVTFTLQTSAAVANRFATVQYIGGDGNPFTVCGAAVVQTAGSTQRYSGSMYMGTSAWATGTDVFFPVTPVFLRGGHTIKINVANIDGADVLSLIYFVWDRFLEAYPA